MNTNEVLEAEKQPEKKNTWKDELISWIQVLASAAAIAFVLTTFIIANSEVPTGSMENTIMAGSRVIGSRLHYKFSEPERGDVAIFVWGWGHKDCRTMFEGEEKDTCPRCGTEVGRDTETIYYVKRIIGVEGDTIEIEEPYLAEEMDPDETYHFEVPEDCYFMMGDNRNYSADARYWRNPYISKDKMIAKVLVEYFPTPKIIK